MIGMTEPCRDTLLNSSRRDHALPILPLHPLEIPGKPKATGTAQTAMCRIDEIAKKVQTARNGYRLLFFRMQTQTQTTRQKFRNTVTYFPKEGFVVLQNHKIVYITDIATTVQRLFDKVVERVEIEIGEELAGLVAERQSASPFGGREEVIAGKIVLNVSRLSAAYGIVVTVMMSL